jgi:hypothetical protein
MGEGDHADNVIVIDPVPGVDPNSQLMRLIGPTKMISSGLFDLYRGVRVAKSARVYFDDRGSYAGSRCYLKRVRINK